MLNLVKNTVSFYDKSAVLAKMEVSMKFGGTDAILINYKYINLCGQYLRVILWFYIELSNGLLHDAILIYPF
jgi:hypothetical protein